MKRLLFLAALAVLIAGNVQAQTVEEMQAEKAAKEAELNALQPQLDELAAKTEALKADIEGLTDKLTPYPRWNKGLLGTMGVNFSDFSDWLPKEQANTTAINIGLNANAFVNGDFEKAFWRNGTNLTLGWLMFDDKSNPDDDTRFAGCCRCL
jgi:opacity protein-like surface antigen